ncbi:MAG: NAD-dependent epimerase/dehydratase family protein [Phycisphaerae bacterium]
MKVLVTGGTGFVGSHLIEALRAAGDSVRAICRPSGDRNLLTRLGAETVPGELEDAASLRAACRGCDVVYHAAARVEIVGDQRDFYETTVAGTQRLVSAALEAGVRRFVYISSCGVYHPKLLDAGRVITEHTPTPVPPRWFVYGRTKLAAEQVVRTQVVAPTEWVIVRLTYIFGPRNRTMHRYLRPFMTSPMLRVVGAGDNEMAMLYVTDAARCVVAAGRSPRAAGQSLIAAGTERVTQRDYLNAMAEGFGAQRPTKSVPYGVAFFCGWLSEWLYRFSAGSAGVSLNRSAIALTGLPQRIDGSFTRELLGWKPQVKFADGVRSAFDWYYNEYPNAVLAPAAPQGS